MKFRKEVNKKDKVEAQWKLLAFVTMGKWRLANPEDKRDDAELVEQFMGECEKEGWCRKVDGVWQLKELKFSKKQFKKQLEELGGNVEQTESS